METKTLFEQAVAASKSLSEKPSNEILLRLYALYKQATEGDVSEDKAPNNPFDFVNKAKFSAWSEVKGETKETAMTDYIALIEKLKS